MDSRLTKKSIIMRGFMGGIAWGVGSVVGATVVVTIIVYILKLLGIFYTVSNYLTNLR